MTRVKMWEAGHSFKEIDNMSVFDVSEVVGVWNGRALGEAKVAASRKRMT